MWFNSMIREEPYPGLNPQVHGPETALSFGTPAKVLHGCRQLVP